MSKKHTLQMLDSIDKNETFSKKSSELNRLFGEHSLNGLIDNLKHKKSYKIDIYKMYENDEKNKHNNNNKNKYYEQNFDINDIKRMIIKLKNDEKNKKTKINEYFNSFKFNKEKILTEEEKQQQKKKLEIRKLSLNQIPNSHRYNPKYKLVTKKIPDVIISREEFDPKKKYKIIGRDIFKVTRNYIEPDYNNYYTNTDYNNFNNTYNISGIFNNSNSGLNTSRQFSNRSNKTSLDFSTLGHAR